MSANLFKADSVDRVQTSLKYEVLVPLIQTTFPQFTPESWITARAMAAALPEVLDPSLQEFQGAYDEFRETVTMLNQDDPFLMLTLGVEWMMNSVDIPPQDHR